MILAEKLVRVPWFVGDEHWTLSQELGPLTSEMAVPPQSGDSVLVRYVGTVHDPDGWPMKLYRMTVERGTE
jgi:hypothetical protein